MILPAAISYESEHLRGPNKVDVAQVIVGGAKREFISTFNQPSPTFSFSQKLRPFTIASSIVKNAMGQQVSVPQAGAEIQVIGAGLPRTRTSSFSAALENLLDRPTYHGGTQISRGAPIEIQSCIKALLG